jgi:hypothetical protein
MYVILVSVGLDKALQTKHAVIDVEGYTPDFQVQFVQAWQDLVCRLLESDLAPPVCSVRQLISDAKKEQSEVTCNITLCKDNCKASL